MNVRATAINDDKGILRLTEVEADTVEAAQERAERVARNLSKTGPEPIGIAYDVVGGRRVRLLDGTELDWDDFLAQHGLKDDGLVQD